MWVLGRFNCVQLFVTPWTVAYQAPLSMGLSWQEYWSGLPFPSPGDLPNPGMEPKSLMSLALAAGGLFTTSTILSSVQLLSPVRLCITMDCSTPGLTIHHQLPEFTQIHVHQVGDVIQPSHLLLSPSPPAFNLFPASESFQMSQFITPNDQSIGVSASASVLPMDIQD